MKAKKLQRCLLYFSLLLDLGMLIQACIAINMVVNAHIEPCDYKEDRLLVSLISCMTLVRVSHLIGMAFFILFCLPCYFCNDQCCIKRRLIGDGGASKIVMDSLVLAWSWTFTPGGTIKINKDPAKDDLVFTGGTPG